MMPDRYDELRKRLLIGQQDAPAVDYNQAVDDMGEPIARAVAAEAPPVTPESRRALQDKADMTRNLSNLIVSAGSTLTGFGRGTAAEQSSRFSQGNEYLKNIGNIEAEKLKKLKEIRNEDGDAEFIAESNAIGMEPYHQLKTVQAAKAAKAEQDRQFQPVTIKNKNTDEVLVAVQNGRGYFDRETGEPYDLREWLPFKSPIILREKTVQGGSVAKAVDPYDTKKTPKISSQRGVGDDFGGVSADQAKGMLGDARKGKDKSIKAVEAYQNASAALVDLSVPSLTAERAAAGIVKIVKATNGERVSDSDYLNLRGSEFKSYIREVEDWASGKVVGKPSDKAIAAFKEIAGLIMKAKKKEAEAIKNSYTPSNTSPSKSGQKTLDIISGKQEADKDWKNKWR
jgi:hypothetical protein